MQILTCSYINPNIVKRIPKVVLNGKVEKSETYSIPLSNISFSMSELDKKLFQSSLFIYFNRFFAKTLLPL